MVSIKYLWDKFTDQFFFLPIHPQFFLKKYNLTAVSFAKKYAGGVLLDVGCGRMPYRKQILPHVEKYLGLDSPKTSSMYHGDDKPDILADATKIPLRDNSIDSVLLLQVLEHLSAPQESLQEIYRVLKPGGILILSTVQLYPLHDEPYDFYRFTKYGLNYLLKTSGFRAIKHKEEGNVFVLIGQSFNVYLMLILKRLVSSGILGVVLAILFSPLIITLTTIVNLYTFPLTLLDKNSKFSIIQTYIAKKL